MPTGVMHPGCKASKRLSISILIAIDDTFLLACDSFPPQIYRAALIGQQTKIEILNAENKKLVLVDVGLDCESYRALMPYINHNEVRALNDDEIARLPKNLSECFETGVDIDEASRMLTEIVAAVASADRPIMRRTHRIRQVLQLLDQQRLDAFSLIFIASQSHLSPSRLRQLFKSEVGCTLSQYARWASVWNAIDLWKSERTLTETVHDAGFHDLAHFDRTFNEFFGATPSEFTKEHNIRLTKFVSLKEEVGSPAKAAFGICLASEEI
jgi:AraC-like DNA-binding protein